MPQAIAAPTTKAFGFTAAAARGAPALARVMGKVMMLAMVAYWPVP
ncbi:hypothetical protein Rhe02_09460 [Rhizocola hellebori]|uniref:Uncharacterized protein n=1 Tax=Rhizocola hellebori TaxID=1392758 RepID=A0A8J3Q361_9ACTN|nr:hypothetical protein Rhe02_09460 [Rhizocola hellebori]